MITKEQFFEYLYSQDYEYLCNDLEKEEVFIRSLVHYKKDLSDDTIFTNLINELLMQNFWFEGQFFRETNPDGSFVLSFTPDKIKSIASLYDVKLSEKDIPNILRIIHERYLAGEQVNNNIIISIINNIKGN